MIPEVTFLFQFLGCLFTQRLNSRVEAARWQEGNVELDQTSESS